MAEEKYAVKGENQYTEIFKDYKEARSLPIFDLLETPSYMKLLGSLDNGTQSVVDIACGEGRYTRRIKSLTKGRVVGIDLSPEMIAQAKMQDDSNSIEYLVMDCCQDIDLGEQFDVVSAAYLLPYSSSKQMLHAFCQTAFNLLKPGGRFIGISYNPNTRKREAFLAHGKYGIFYTTQNEVCQDGDTIRTMVKDSRVKFNVNYWSPEVHDWAFGEAGFVGLHWIKFELINGGIEQEYWEDFLTAPVISLFEAIKPVVVLA